MIGEQDIGELFQDQLDKIGDQGLREKVVRTWVLGCQRGKWDSIAELKKMPFTLLTETHGVDFISHTIAVTEGAVSLARSQESYYKKLPYH